MQPVNEAPPFVNISAQKHSALFDSLNTENLWKKLFSYDELTQNVRQRDDQEYANALSEIRLGILSESSEQLLLSKEITGLPKNSIKDCLNELANYIRNLPNNSICLFPTRAQCTALNIQMLENINGPKIVLKAIDQVESKTKKQGEAAKKKLENLSGKNKSSFTAGLDDEIEIKLGAKVMLLRNIEVASGLVNGAIGIVKKVQRSITSNNRTIEKLCILFDCGEREIEPVKTIFEILSGVLVTRTQFPITLAYAITIHKSQGLTVSSCVIDIGESIFSSGQSYVALSRVKSLNGLHILNLNPRSIKANEAAIEEYNRLRREYKPDLNPIVVSKSTNKLIYDTNVYIKRKSVGFIQPMTDASTSKKNTKNISKASEDGLNVMRGFVNSGNACYANASLQCLLNMKSVRDKVLVSRDCDLKKIFTTYIQRSKPNDVLNLIEVDRMRMTHFNNLNQQDATEFLGTLFADRDSNYLIDLCRVDIRSNINCSNCDYTNSIDDHFSIMPLHIPTFFEHSMQKISMANLLQFQGINQWQQLADSECENCNAVLQSQTVVQSTNQILIFSLQLLDQDGTKNTTFKLSDVHRNDIEFGNKRYAFSGGIFHHGSRFSEGHYTAIVRKDNNNFFKANDRNVNICKKWPNNSKDIYVLFYEQK